VAILEELRIDEIITKPKRSDVEVEDSAITVYDHDVISRPYESEAERNERLRREEEARRKVSSHLILIDSISSKCVFQKLFFK
jgi:hypothetical protein